MLQVTGWFLLIFAARSVPSSAGGQVGELRADVKPSQDPEQKLVEYVVQAGGQARGVAHQHLGVTSRRLPERSLMRRAGARAGHDSKRTALQQRLHRGHTHPVHLRSPAGTGKHDRSRCTSVVGAWQLGTSEQQGARDVYIFRRAEGKLLWQQPGPFPFGFRSGYLLANESHSSCSFKVSLHDGTDFDLSYLAADLPEQQEVMKVKQLAPEGWMEVATRPPPLRPLLHKLAWMLVVLLCLSSPATVVLTLGATRRGSRDLGGSSEKQTGVGAQKPSLEVTSVEAPQPGSGSDGWVHAFRLTCIALMVLRHIFQSLDRLQRLPAALTLSFRFAFFLHGLAFFVYLAGHACGTNLASRTTFGNVGNAEGDWLMKHRTFLWHRASRLLLPDLLGTLFVVIPTEYVGRRWRPCAQLGLDAPSAWLSEYIFGSTGKGLLHCEGFGWLGFLTTLLVVQVLLHPWAAALSGQPLGRRLAASEAVLSAAWAVTGLWFLALVSGLPGDPFVKTNLGRGLRGLFRPDTALVCALTAADLLSLWLVSVFSAQPRHLQQRVSRGLWWSGLFRRIVASVALAALTIETPYDQTVPNSAIWSQLLLFLIFYQQGVANSVLEAPALRQLSLSPRLRAAAGAVWIAASVAVIFSGVPGQEAHAVGVRYPALQGGSAGFFVLQTWGLLVISIVWFRWVLAGLVDSASKLAPLGFATYVFHWFFIELTMSYIYQQPCVQGSPPRGDMPWWLAFLLCLVTTSVGTYVMVLVLTNGYRRAGLGVSASPTKKDVT